MISFLLTLNLAASMLAPPNANFNYIYNHLSDAEQSILDSNDVNTYEEFDEFVRNFETRLIEKYGHLRAYRKREF